METCDTKMFRAADANSTTYEKYKTISTGTYISLCATEHNFIQTFLFSIFSVFEFLPLIAALQCNGYDY